MKILMAPFTENNPYQGDLLAGIRSYGDPVDTRSTTQCLPLWLGAYDVLHLHWLHPYYRGGYALTRWVRLVSFLLSLGFARLAGCTVVWTVHNLHAHETDHPRLDRLITAWVVRLASGFIVHCDWAKQELMRIHPMIDEAQVAVVPHGNYIEAYASPPDRGAARRALGIPAGHRVFLFFGFIRPYKGIDELIGAYRELRRDHPVSLIVAGKPADQALGQSITDACDGLDDVHLMLDYIDSDEVPGLFAATDCYVLPYRDIVTSGAALLGMSMGRALVAPRLGCMPDTVDARGGWLFDPAASDGLVSAMRSALQDGVDIDAMGGHNKTTVEPWDWRSIARATLDFFTLLKEGPGSS